MQYGSKFKNKYILDEENMIDLRLYLDEQPHLDEQLFF